MACSCTLSIELGVQQRRALGNTRTVFTMPAEGLQQVLTLSSTQHAGQRLYGLSHVTNTVLATSVVLCKIDQQAGNRSASR